jgi:hypothetical protein
MTIQEADEKLPAVSIVHQKPIKIKSILLPRLNGLDMGVLNPRIA